MKFEKIMVNFGSTINTGEYESKRVDLEAVVFLEEGETFDESSEKLKKILQEKVELWEGEIRSRNGNKKNLTEKSIESDGDRTIKNNESVICPKCGEKMVKKEGKEYYICSKHWGYPDMIHEGLVRDKR